MWWLAGVFHFSIAVHWWMSRTNANSPNCCCPFAFHLPPSTLWSSRLCSACDWAGASRRDDGGDARDPRAARPDPQCKYRCASERHRTRLPSRPPPPRMLVGRSLTLPAGSPPRRRGLLKGSKIVSIRLSIK